MPFELSTTKTDEGLARQIEELKRVIEEQRRAAASLEHLAVIRDVLGIQKRREMSESERERLRSFAFTSSPRREAGSISNIAPR